MGLFNIKGKEYGLVAAGKGLPELLILSIFVLTKGVDLSVIFLKRVIAGYAECFFKRAKPSEIIVKESEGLDLVA